MIVKRLDKGTYEITETINIDNPIGRITFIGSGRDDTILKFRGVTEMTKMTIGRDLDGNLEFKGTVSRCDLENLKLDPLDNLVLRECTSPGRSAADLLIGLEIIFRRIAEQRTNGMG